MTRKELNIAIFEGTANAVLWQPRLETWIYHHQAKGTLPDRYKDLDYFGIYDALHCSLRYAACAGIESHEDPTDVERSEERLDEHHLAVKTRTPSGDITAIHQLVVVDGNITNQRIHGFPVKTVQDLRVFTDLVERQQFRVNLDAYQAAADAVGDRAEPTMFLTSSGFTDLIKWGAGLVDTCYLLADQPKEVEAYLDACNARDDRMIEQALKLPYSIFNLGDHATNEFTPPPILKKYLLPRWQNISARLH